MTKQYRFYLIEEGGSGDVTGTDDIEIATAAKRDGTTLVIEPSAGEFTFEGDVNTIQEANSEDYPTADADEDDEGDN